MTSPAVLLFRASKESQAEDGYSLEAQRADFNNYLNKYGFHVVREFTEVVSGDKKKRPELNRALNYCRRHKVTLLVAKLDRLTRRPLIVDMLLESNIDWRVVEFPEIIPKDTPEFFQMLGIVAGIELRNIRKRTKAGLAVAKSKGVVLGRNGKVLAEKNKKAADEFAQIMMPELQKAQAEGFSLRATAENWNYRHIPTARGNGCQWDATTVFHLSKRIERISKNQSV